MTYIINAPKLFDLSDALIAVVHQTEGAGTSWADVPSAYVSRLHTTLSSYVISGILGLVSILVGGVAAYIHIKHVVNGPFWGALHRTFLTTTLLLGLLYVVACLAWFVILMTYVGSWMTALWAFEQGAAVQAGVLAAAASSLTQGGAGVCADACLNLGAYPFFGGVVVADDHAASMVGCVCDAEVAAGLGGLAGQARGKGMWVLVGVAAVCVGLVLSVVNVAADMGGTWVVIHAEVQNVVYRDSRKEAYEDEDDDDDDAVSGISSAVNTTPATQTKEYVKSRLGGGGGGGGGESHAISALGGLGSLGSLGAVPGHLAAPSHLQQLQHASGVFSSNV